MSTSRATTAIATKFTRSPPNFPRRLVAAIEWSRLFLLHRAVGLLSEFESAPRTKATFLVCETCLRFGGGGVNLFGELFENALNKTFENSFTVAFQLRWLI
jgi:hypothetical protein